MSPRLPACASPRHRPRRESHAPRTSLLILLVGLLVTSRASAGRASSDLVAELRIVSTRYHENPARLDQIRDRLEREINTNSHTENLLALAQVCFIWGDVRATTRDEKLEAYERGREIATILDLDPHLTSAYGLAGYFFYEVPGLFGGDLDKAEQMFRKGLEQDPKFTALRVGLAKTLIKKDRIEEARRELHTVLNEEEPHNLADWTLKDSPEARELLDSITDRSADK